MSTASPLVGADVLRQVKNIELRTRRLVTDLFSGEYRSVFRGHGMEFAEVRAYQHGDEYRSIDWNVSARMGSPYVKVFEEERELTLLLVVDRSGSEEFGAPVTKSERGVEVAAVLALAAARQNDRVGALIFQVVLTMWCRQPKAGATPSVSSATSLLFTRWIDERTSVPRWHTRRDCCETGRSWSSSLISGLPVGKNSCTVSLGVTRLWR